MAPDDLHSNTSPSDSPDELARQKTQAEIAKLKAERDDISSRATRWSKLAGNCGPLLAAVAAAVFLWSNGWFEAKNTKLENIRHDLEATNAVLQVRAVQLSNDVAAFQTERDELRRTNEKLKATLDRQQRDLMALTNLVMAYATNLVALTESNKLLQPLVSELARVKVEREAALRSRPPLSVDEFEQRQFEEQQMQAKDKFARLYMRNWVENYYRATNATGKPLTSDLRNKMESEKYVEYYAEKLRLQAEEKKAFDATNKPAATDTAK